MRNILYNLAKLFQFPLRPENDERVRDMLDRIKALGGLDFEIKLHKRGWTAECTNLRGIITGGTNPKPTQEEVDDQVRDAIFSAFDIPPYLCRDGLVRNICIEKPLRKTVYA